MSNNLYLNFTLIFNVFFSDNLKAGMNVARQVNMHHLKILIYVAFGIPDRYYVSPTTFDENYDSDVVDFLRR